MCLFLLVIFSLISASAAEFRRCSPQWVNAGQVKVSCNNTLIAQHCDPDQSCRNTSKPGVSLEKDRERVCLTITNCSYDSWSCEARSYIDGEEFGENFTVSLTCNRAAEVSPATTQEFRRYFPQWVNASQVQVSCNNTLIAQHCDPDQSCRNTSKPGVSLEKDRERVCLTITNCSYDSWSCEARSYIDGEEFGENVTVNVTCNREVLQRTPNEVQDTESEERHNFLESENVV
ncbi:hypothetical protein cypCar_00046595 [Cyprinus carpio]|nr:hypothetical protein cypCar_00046595 [Cyprinus carpio]